MWLRREAIFEGVLVFVVCVCGFCLGWVFWGFFVCVFFFLFLSVVCGLSNSRENQVQGNL